VLRTGLAHLGHHLGRNLYQRLSSGDKPMTQKKANASEFGDVAPGDAGEGKQDVRASVRNYLIGLCSPQVLPQRRSGSRAARVSFTHGELPWG
jgi:hypothetical protein